MVHGKNIMTHYAQVDSLAVGVINCSHGSRATSRSSGFTLIELLVVVAVLGILAALAIPSYKQYADRAKNSNAKSDLRTVSTEVNSFYMDRNTYPATLSDIPNRANFPDPWGTQYVYNNIKLNGGPLMDPLNVDPLNKEYDLYSKGADRNSVAAGGDAANFDDIVVFNDGTYIDNRQ